MARGHYFYGASFLAATCSMSFWSTRYGIFWEFPSGNVPVLSAIWFDSGHMFASAHEVLSDKGVDMPVVMQDSLVQTVQRPVAAPQVQFLARLWMCLSLCNDRCLVFMVPQFCSSVMDVAVNMQRHVVSRQSSASDSVHRRSLWTFPFATETGTHSCSCAWRALSGRHGGRDEGRALCHPK